MSNVMLHVGMQHGIHTLKGGGRVQKHGLHRDPLWVQGRRHELEAMMGERVEHQPWVSLGVWGGWRCCGDDEGEQPGSGVRRWKVGDSQRGRACEEATHSFKRRTVGQVWQFGKPSRIDSPM